FTLTIELVGAVLLYISLGHRWSIDLFSSAGMISAMFHSLSAFCHAGFSLFPESLAASHIQSNWLFSIVIMVLVFFGSIGFPVLLNLYDWLRSRSRSWYQGKVLIRVHTKLVLITTALLIILGTLGVYLLE